MKVGAERALLVGVGLKDQPFSEVKEDLCELEDLAIAAGAEVVGLLTQILPAWNPATLIGSGKVEQVAQQAEGLQASLVIVDHRLSGVQIRNLQEILKCRVIDRTQLILDIFAQRAQTYEGKLQVELAQLLDQMPRMVGAWHGSLSRLGGGIGTRGPGEKAIETDRRQIQNRIDRIKKELKAVQKNRAQYRGSRRRREIPSFALIGYTNSGKSTLLNQLTKSEVFTKDQLFATLDSTTRKIHLPAGPPAVVTDTVGFIKKLPTQLIEAFRATLEESAEADVLLHVIDLSSPNRERHLEAVNLLITEFDWGEKPLISVFNKIDQASPEKKFQVHAHPRAFVSAKTGEGLEALKEKMVETLNSIQIEVELFFPKDQEHRIFDLSREARIISKSPASTGVICVAGLPRNRIARWTEFSTQTQFKLEES